QRTRPCASLRGSPLTRHPLGNRRRLLGVFSLLLAVASISCSQGPRQTGSRPPAVAKSKEVAFHIRLAGTKPPEDLSGVEVSLVAGNGELVPVTTSFRGVARVSKAKVAELHTTLILFCSPTTFCGAVRVAQGSVSILDFD